MRIENGKCKMCRRTALTLERNKVMRRSTLCILHFAFSVFFLSGCFDEPEPAYKTVPAEARAYLQERGFADFASAASGLDAKVVDYINLDRNVITNLDGIAAFGGLKWLRLNDNKLSSLPPLDSLVSLRRIYLRNNVFTEVPEQLRDLPSLTDIELSGNPIREVPDWLAQKKGLEFLSLSGTLVERLPSDISAWKGMKALQLGELKISPEEMARIRKALPDVAIVF